MIRQFYLIDLFHYLFVIGIILAVEDTFIDVHLQILSAYTLTAISLVLILKRIRTLILPKLNDKDHDHNHSHHDHDHGGEHHYVHTSSDSVKTILILGVVAGLAPCLFAWAVFPVMFCFGLFVELILIVVLVSVFRQKLMNRFEVIMRFSPLISSFLCGGISAGGLRYILNNYQDQNTKNYSIDSKYFKGVLF